MWANCALQGKRSAHSDMCAQNGRLTEVGRLEKGQTVIGFAQSRHIYTWSHTTYRGARRPPASYRLWCSQPQVRPTCVATFPPGGHSGDGVPACLVRAAGARRGSGRSWTPGSGHGRLRTKTPLRKASRKPIISCEMLAFLSASVRQYRGHPTPPKQAKRHAKRLQLARPHCPQPPLHHKDLPALAKPSDHSVRSSPALCPPRPR